MKLPELKRNTFPEPVVGANGLVNADVLQNNDLICFFKSSKLHSVKLQNDIKMIP